MMFLGVDGGGTKTTAVLTDGDGGTVRQARGGPGNVALLDRGSIAELLRGILDALIGGPPYDRIAGAVFAFAGVGRPRVRQSVREIIEGAGLGHVTIMTDAEIVYESVFAEERGILLSAGTGSICLTKRDDGGFHQIGGVGYLLGDEGSGFDIGNRAIRLAVRQAELPGEPTPLTVELLAFYGLREPRDLVSIIYSSPNPQRLVASCARLVCDMAERGDPVAGPIVDAAVGSLLELARRALETLPAGDSVPIALGGSVLKPGSLVRERFAGRAEAEGLAFTYRNPEMEPAAAALLHALKQAGKPINKSFVETLKTVTF